MMELRHVRQCLENFATDVIARYRNFLMMDDRYASGALVNNVSYVVKDTDEDTIDVYLILEEYWYEIEYGRKPTQNMADGKVYIRIGTWMRQKNIKPFNGDFEAAQFAITQKIHNEGFKGGKQKNGIGYLERAIDYTYPLYSSLLDEAAIADFEDDLNSLLEEVKITL